MGAAGKGTPTMQCLLCDEHLLIKSNLAIKEELQRFTKHFHKKLHYCATEGCANAGIAAPDKSAYHAFGRTDSGSTRYRCRSCKRTFSVSNRATIRQREARKNVPILTSLMNKAPLSRAADTHDVSFQTLYDKIDFFENQALAFCASVESRIPDIVKGTKRYVAVDRQEYIVNWNHRKDKRNVVLRAIGSADVATGYVWGMHLNFDGALDSKTIDDDAKACGDHQAPLPHRKHARLWLAPDYATAVARSERRSVKKSKTGANLHDNITDRYAEAVAREDIESPEALTSTERLPARGMQVRSEYTMYAHFYYLHHILGSAIKTRFFLDQESGIRAACMAVFGKEISNRTCDAFYVRLGKELTIDEKRKLIRKSREAFAAVQKENPSLTDYQVKVLMMKDAIAASSAFGKWLDRWAVHPFPNGAEPEKAVCYLTDFSDLDAEHKARLFLKASLHPIDRFFMSIRRRLNMLERPIGTSSQTGRNWYGYSAYQPANIEKLLNIFRAYYNFCLRGADDKTPAMRLGLLDRPATPSELLGM
jgi:transposase-like protein